MMAKGNIQNFINRIDNLPTLPNIVTKLLEVIDDSGSASKDLANIISKDEALTSKILRLGNSAFYGMTGKISSVNHGVVMLGYHNVKNLAMGISLFKSIGGGKNTLLNMERFWEHSLACAITTRLIAQKTGYHCPEEAFVAGLLHDVGKVIINMFSPEEYEKTIELAQEAVITIVKAEEKRIGYTHTTVGEWAAKEWRLPPVLAKVIRYHHHTRLPDSSLSDEEKRVVTIVAVGNSLCKHKGFRLWEGESVSPINHEMLESIQLHKEKIKEVYSSIDSEMIDARKLFGLAPVHA